MKNLFKSEKIDDIIKINLKKLEDGDINIKGWLIGFSSVDPSSERSIYIRNEMKRILNK